MHSSIIDFKVVITNSMQHYLIASTTGKDTGETHERHIFMLNTRVRKLAQRSPNKGRKKRTFEVKYTK